MKNLAIRLIRSYQRNISADRPPSCRFSPTCSHYGIEAIEHYGVLRGGFKTAWRIARCNPFNEGGYDPPVPDATAPTDQATAAAGESQAET
ncbi:MAG: membrane protein insertion efficiency factor YidD [Dehalococcoidia bacterium]